ncbi:hypothetical protein T11_3619 [Trichinella zimbabwensis]|uniref:Uncharacterized protein n=1 Tax=Trichinella zimbabwensis TaxID=268475 RepID=A0A0V1DT27_9BILA|nr:hypothetical protein T11_3619 [Trichinella zimbabwensis]
MEPRQDSDQGSNLSEQPFSRNSPNSQFAVNSGKSWRTG